MKNLLSEFKKFAMRGNVVDLAVAVVIGGAFGKIVSSLTEDIIMPVIGVLTGGIDFSNFSLTLKVATSEAPAVALRYGLFLNAVLIFVIVAFAIFMIVKVMNKLQSHKEEEETKKVLPTKQEELLAEIRDILSKGTAK
jgi:large conductance mechanosensitive channel